MTSVAKASIVPDNTALVATQVKNAADVTLASNSNSDNIAEGYVGVSPNDTHVKHLLDACNFLIEFCFFVLTSKEILST